MCLLKIKNDRGSCIYGDLGVASGASRSVAQQVACQLVPTSAAETYEPKTYTTAHTYSLASYPSNYPT